MKIKKQNYRFCLYLIFFLSSIFFASNSTLALGPSFDCTKAKTTIEQYICQNEELARLDLEMTDIYKKHLNTLKGKEKSMFIDEQKSWLKNRQIECEIIELKTTSAQSQKEKTNCLIYKYKERISELISIYNQSNTSFYKLTSRSAADQKICELIISGTETKSNLKFIKIPTGPNAEEKQPLEIDINNDGKNELLVENYGGSLAYPYLTIRFSDGGEEHYSSEYTRGSGKNYKILSYRGRNYIAAFCRDNETMYIIEYLDEKNPEYKNYNKEKLICKKKFNKTYKYKLTMCKNPSICNHFLNILNNDMVSHKKIIYENHPEFNSIQWEEISKDDYCQICEKLNIDINNDKIKEQMIRLTGCLRGIQSHDIYIFKNSQSSDKKACKAYAMNPVLKIQRTGGFYELKEIPKIKLDGVSKEQLVYNKIGGMFVIHPILYDSKYYLGLTTLTEGVGIEDTNNWYVILEITKDFKINDLCYFKISNH